MKRSLLMLSAMLACGFVAGSAFAADREERREERREIDWDKEKIERGELRDAVEKEFPVVAAEHRKELEGLRESLKSEKFDHVGELKRLYRGHRELVEHLVNHIHEARDRHRERR